MDDQVSAQLADLTRLQHLQKIFVLGCAKSGTTWVRNLLDGHTRAVVSGEGGFAWRLVPVLLQSFKSYNTHQQQHGLGSTALTEPDQLVAARLLIDSRLLEYVRSSETPLDQLIAVGDKTPQHSVTMDPLTLLYPSARFVHVIRDPRDVATSAWFHLGRTDGRSLEEYVRYFITKVWPLNVGSARKSGRRLGDRYIEIRYEDLLTAPEKETRTLLERLGLPAGDAEVRSCIEAGRFEMHSGGRPRGKTDPNHFYRAGVAGDWANHLPLELVVQSCRAIEPLMSAMGYALESNEPHPAPSLTS